MAQSQSRKVLVLRVVTDLVAGAGLKFAERGSHELQGLPGRRDFFAASAWAHAAGPASCCMRWKRNTCCAVEGRSRS